MHTGRAEGMAGQGLGREKVISWETGRQKSDLIYIIL